MSLPAEPRPDLFELTQQEKDRVRTQLRRRRSRCGACGGSEFEIGYGFYLGFLFVGEALENYMVGLTCQNPDCLAPYTGTTVRESQVLSEPRRYPT
jgi:preprotein translocase subunit SecA